MINLSGIGHVLLRVAAMSATTRSLSPTFALDVYRNLMQDRCYPSTYSIVSLAKRIAVARVI